MRKLLPVLVILLLLPAVHAECQACIAQKGAALSSLVSQVEISITPAVQVELKIENRSMWKRIFFGGDIELGRQLEQLTSQMSSQVDELRNNAEECDGCDTDMLKKAQQLVNEHKRLASRAEIEQASRGLFGWFRK